MSGNTVGISRRNNVTINNSSSSSSTSNEYGGLSFLYKYKTNTSPSPVSSCLRFDDTTLSSATKLYINNIDKNDNDISDFLTTLHNDIISRPIGYIKIMNRTTLGGDDFIIFEFSTCIEDSESSYHTLDIEHKSGSVNFFDNQEIVITFSIRGEKGDKGDSGDALEPLTDLTIRSLGVGVQASGTQGHILATDIDIVNTSDIQLKENFEILNDPIEKLNQINGYLFHWKNRKIHSPYKDIGVIAQEIEKQFPQLIKTNRNGFKAVYYYKLIPLLIESVKYINWKINLFIILLSSFIIFVIIFFIFFR